MGIIDRVIRLAAGLALLYLGLIDTTLVENVLARIMLTGLGLLNIVSALISNCILYGLAGINTAKKPTADH